MNILKDTMPPKKTKAKKPQTRKYGWLYLSCYLIAIPVTADASVVGPLNALIGLMTGVWGTAVATLSMLVCGYLCFGKHIIPKTAFYSVVIGISITFGAAQLVSVLHGS